MHGMQHPCSLSLFAWLLLSDYLSLPSYSLSHSIKDGADVWTDDPEVKTRGREEGERESILLLIDFSICTMNVELSASHSWDRDTCSNPLLPLCSVRFLWHKNEQLTRTVVQQHHQEKERAGHYNFPAFWSVEDKGNWLCSDYFSLCSCPPISLFINFISRMRTGCVSFPELDREAARESERVASSGESVFLPLLSLSLSFSHSQTQAIWCRFACMPSLWGFFASWFTLHQGILPSLFSWSTSFFLSLSSSLFPSFPLHDKWALFLLQLSVLWIQLNPFGHQTTLYKRVPSHLDSCFPGSRETFLSSFSPQSVIQ